MLKLLTSEISAIIYALIFWVFLTLITGLWSIALALTMTGYVVWLYYRIYRLNQWLDNGTKTSQVYDDQGIFNQIIRHIYQQKKVYNKRKKRTKEILRRLNTNISALPDATVLLNDQMEIEWSNKPAHYLLGINARLDLGMHIGNLIRHPKFLRYLMAPENNQHLEIDSPVDRQTTIQIKIVEFGKNQRLLTARNITDQKQIQEGLKSFIANASHELKTPLTVISGYLEMLQFDEQLGKHQQTSVKAALQQSERMKNLIEDLLLLSQVESYQLQPSEGETQPICELTANSLGALGKSCNDSLLDCSCDDTLALNGVRAEIEGILINLVDNAFKYSPEDSPVTIRWTLNDREELIFECIDQGRGIAEKDLEKITDRYYRSPDVRGEQIKGSGLGLAIVKQASAKHGARLEIHSEPGEGSSFTITFPSYRTIHLQSSSDNVVPIKSA